MHVEGFQDSSYPPTNRTCTFQCIRLSPRCNINFLLRQMYASHFFTSLHLSFYVSLCSLSTVEFTGVVSLCLLIFNARRTDEQSQGMNLVLFGLLHPLHSSQIPFGSTPKESDVVHRISSFLFAPFHAHLFTISFLCTLTPHDVTLFRTKKMYNPGCIRYIR